MKAAFYVTKEMDCPDCEGAGRVEHAAWTKFFAEHGSLTSDDLFDGVVEEWFREEGYDYPPDQEHQCPFCNGEGRIRREVSLVEALSELGVEMKNKSLRPSHTRPEAIGNRKEVSKCPYR